MTGHPAGIPRHGAHPHASMRREEREITDRAEIDAILAANTVMTLALADDGIPFAVPVFYAYDGQCLWFHSAPSGSKIDILKRNPTVCFVVSMDQGLVVADKACDFEARHRTVIGVGQAVFVEDRDTKIAALDRIVARFTLDKFDYPEANLNHTRVIRIDIASVKGKKHGV